MRRNALAIVAAVAGLAVLIGVALAATSGGGGPEPQGNLLVNREGMIDVSNSPTVAYNPAREGNVVVTYRKDRPGYDALISYSFNGGDSWEQSILPLPQGITGCTASQGAPCPFAPDLAFAPDGTLYVVYVNLVGNGNRPDNLWISTSTDGGRTLSLPTKIAGPLTFQQRVTVDPKGPVYVTYVQAAEVGFLRFADPPPRIVTARSDDGAKTFGAPVPVSDQARPRVLAPSPVIDRDGQLVVMYQDMKGNRRDYEYQEGPAAELPVALVLTRSTDGGRTLSLPTKIAGPLTFQQRVTVDPKGPVYVTWLQAAEVGFLRFAEPPPRIVTARSDDGGKTFGAPVPVSDQQRPRVLAPSPVIDRDGQLVVMYQDMKGNRRDYEYQEGPAAELPVALVLTRSTDGGRT
ncbi:MAG TPA: sialidase family protein, partial [Acidimicrobiales bacterium]|nr:sialidase family protein [Acidimicrobiales bacterium]